MGLVEVVEGFADGYAGTGPGLLSAVGCPMKAKEIAVLLSRKTGESNCRGDVNRVLYPMLSEGIVARDDTNCWRIAGGIHFAQSRPIAAEVARCFRAGRRPEQPASRLAPVETWPVVPVSEAQVRRVLGIPEPSVPLKKATVNSVRRCLRCANKVELIRNIAGKERNDFCSDDCYEVFMAYLNLTPGTTPSGVDAPFSTEDFETPLYGSYLVN